jgi:alkaline phosphatase D
LIITDQRSYRSEEPTYRPEAQAFVSDEFPGLVPQEILETLDGGAAYNGGHPPATIKYGGKDFVNFRKDQPPTTILGAEQKAWFLERLQKSAATWKIWGDTIATLDMRADPQNLPAGLTQSWPGAGYAGFDASTGAGDHGTTYVERGEICDFVRDHGITGFATVAGDRHSFWAGLAAKSLPPRPFEPVGIAFVTGSISAPGIIEAFEHALPKEHPLRFLFVGQGPGDTRPQPTMNVLLKHGVRSTLEYVKSGDLRKARALSNPDLSPHVSFVDMGGHGYAVVRVTSDMLETEFVCIPRPIERTEREDGGPLLYRTRHHALLWRKGESPKLELKILEGDPRFSV